MNVCVVKNIEIQPTETFIQAHITNLDARVIDGRPPRLHGTGVRRPSGLARIAARLARQSPGKGGEQRARTLEYAHLFKAARPDVVLAEYGTTGAVVWEACKANGLPLVVHFHGYDASRADVLKSYAQGYQGMFEYASAVVAVSRVMRERLVSLGAPVEKVVLNPYPVDSAAFSVGRPDEAPPTFLAVGRLVEKKAPHLLLAAFAEVHRQFPDARLRIVGDGPLLDIVRDLVAGLHLNGAVDLLGSQPHSVVAEEMHRARAFVQHSVTASDGDMEGTPNSILEASASGLPVVSTDHAGIPDSVSDGVTGFIVAERDVRGMTERMLEVARDPALARRFGLAGRERVIRLYGKDLRLDRLRAILRQAYEGSPPSPDLLKDLIDIAVSQEAKPSP